MAKKQEKEEILNFDLVIRPVIRVPHRKIDRTIETEQGKEQSVKKLFEDYVLGRLDPRQLGGGSYDTDDSDEVDPFNKPGLTFEEATQISDAGRTAAKEVKQRVKITDHPRVSSEQPENKEQTEPSK